MFFSVLADFNLVFYILLMLILDLLQYGVKIFVITSFKDTCYIEILPNIQKSERGTSYSYLQSWLITFDMFGNYPNAWTFTTSYAVISLSFWAEVHYNSIYPQGGNVKSQVL